MTCGKREIAIKVSSVWFSDKRPRTFRNYRFFYLFLSSSFFLLPFLSSRSLHNALGTDVDVPYRLMHLLTKQSGNASVYCKCNGHLSHDRSFCLADRRHVTCARWPRSPPFKLRKIQKRTRRWMNWLTWFFCVFKSHRQRFSDNGPGK